MDVTVEQVNTLTRRLRVALPVEKVAKEMEAAYRKLKTDVAIKGFRRGKVPQTMLEKAYGEQVKAEVGEKLVQATYFDAVEQEKLDTVVHPEITSHSFAADGTFIYEAEVDVRPQFELKPYKALELTRPATAVSDEEVAAELEQLQRQMAPLRSVEDRVVQMNDIVILDFQGYDNGEPLKQIKGSNTTIDVGSGRNGQEFEEKLVGLTKGGEGSFEVSFPAESANPMLAGRTVEFKVAIHDIKERVLPAIDDEFAREVDSEFASLDALKEHIRQRQQKEKEDAQEGDLADQLMQKLLELNEFEVPARLVRYEIEEYIKQAEAQLKRSGLTLESAGVNLNDLAGRYRETAEKRVRGDFILKKISEQEDIKVKDEDLDRGLSRIAGQYNMTVDEVKGYFKSRDDMLPFLNELLNEKILKFLLAEARYSVAAVTEQGAGSTEQATAGDAA